MLPCAVYGTLAIAAVFLCMDRQIGFFFVAGAALGLLLIGIHNAWDTVTHIVVTESHGG